MYDCNATVNVCRSLLAFPAQKVRGRTFGEVSLPLCGSDAKRPWRFRPERLVSNDASVGRLRWRLWHIPVTRGAGHPQFNPTNQTPDGGNAKERFQP